MKHQSFFIQLSAGIVERSILKHPFYQAWQKGLLKKEELQEYIKQYYHLESAFPRFQSSIHANCTSNEMRKVMLEDLYNEEGPATNHVNQLLTFAQALDISQEELNTSSANKHTKIAIQTILGITYDKNIIRGMAVLATYKEQIQKVAETKEQGLKKYYGVTDAKALEFFSTHSKKNTLWHELLDSSLTGRYYNDALEASETLCNAWWGYLDGVTTPGIKTRAHSSPN